MRRWGNIWFLILLLGVFLWGGIAFVKEETLVSKMENRNLQVFPHLTLASFEAGNFQDEFEAALSDQFVGSEQIRVFYRQALANLPTSGLKEIICHNRYLELTSDTERRRGTFNCEDYIMYLPEPITEEQEKIVVENINKYNHLNRMSEVYYYFVDDPSSFDFEQNERVVDYSKILVEGLKAQAGLDVLKYDDFEAYKKYFYKTDHHWDYRGSYQGVNDILEMMKIKNTLEPKEVFTNHESFFGSYARGTNNYDFEEEFKFYDFEIPEHTTLINGKQEKYNHYTEYKNHDYEYEKAANYYAYVYGDDYAEVVFDFREPEEDNLLIISNSYSNAINELIAQYFNKTYVVDLRHYKETFNKDFEVSKYLKEKEIDKVLVLMSPTFIRAEESNRGLES